MRPLTNPGTHRHGQQGSLITSCLIAALAGCGSASDSGGVASPSVGAPGQGAGPSPALSATSIAGAPGFEAPVTGTNVSFGGAQDIGFLRSQLEAGQVPSLDSLDEAGFFAEHHIALPPPSCGARVCLQPMIGVMGNLVDGSPCTMLHLGLNSPIKADPAQRPPLDLAVVVDVSGSMAGEKLAYVQEGLGLLIDSMRDGDRLSLITYSDLAQVAQPLAPVAEQRVALRRAAQGLIASGGTNLADGLDTGFRELLDNFESDREHRVILLSDGNPTQGLTDTASILALSRGYNSEGIGLSTIGLGSDFNIDLMRGLSQQADGNFYFLEDAGAVDEVFTEELSFFVVPVAFDLQLTLTAGDSYDFARAYGAPLWHDTSTGGNLEIPSVFLAHRKAASDVTKDDGRRGGGSSLIVELLPKGDALDERDATIATVELSFRDPSTDERVHDSVALGYPGRLGDVPSAGYFEADELDAAHKSFLMLNVYVGLERAITDYQDGNASAETIAELDALIAAVRDYNEEIADKDVELDLELLDMLRQNLRAAGIPERRTVVKADPWPAD